MNPEYSGTDRPVDRWTKYRALTRLADAVQPLVQSALAGGRCGRTLNELLHGTPLGHPLHPLLTDVPIGAWTVTAVCDIAELLGARRYHEAADVALAVGMLGAAGAAATGLAEWSDTKDEPQRLGMLHALVNGGALATYLTSYVARRRGARMLGIGSALIAYGATAFAGYLGGELSFGMQLGAKHVAVPGGEQHEFIRVLDAAQLEDAGMQAVEADGAPLLVTRAGDRVCAVGAVCTHRGAPLAEGTQEGACVRCPWHGSRFSLNDGRVIGGPATFPLPRAEARITAGTVEIRLPGPASERIL